MMVSDRHCRRFVGRASHLPEAVRAEGMPARQRDRIGPLAEADAALIHACKEKRDREEREREREREEREEEEERGEEREEREGALWDPGGHYQTTKRDMRL
ncbi:hypothetical protein THAOC_19962 [Thalassiosira oceanica]|uniref:Uncharacterized protein n=1 Tax=Thalassiosira oceanica TaxID=159749 RepID=K0SFT6_THAOC|nr:hypothetical protein THAOC_19962 [Thalassiosira oceanica]|eukprot:EJK59776.1 hypothetical protein THAOC_19962 [Thalassiosira oceanica]